MFRSLKPGEIFDGRYQIEEIIGRGGNGTVYKAIQLDCKRIIALKILHPDYTKDDESRERFLREAKA